MTNLRLIHYGLGPIGSAIAGLVAGRGNLQAVGAVDVAADKVGRPLRDLVPEANARLRVRSALAELNASSGAVVVHSTSSALKLVLPQLGTGVNPGFAMDYLPIVLSGASATVTGVSVHRVQDAGVRRVPLQHKVGATLTVGQFQDRVKAGTVRHVGLPSPRRLSRPRSAGSSAAWTTRSRQFSPRNRPPARWAPPRRGM